MADTATKATTATDLRVYICYAGGTIGMAYDARQGLVPEQGLLGKLVRERLGVKQSMRVRLTIHEMEPLIDSSNLMADQWFDIVDALQRAYADHDAFIVIHGTDTMAYTASALSFLLLDWTKPVVVTGSQIPLVEYRNDARRNLVDAVTVCALMALQRLAVVVIVFGTSIVQGNRAVKQSSTSFQAYASPNHPLLGRIGVHVDIATANVDTGDRPSTLGAARRRKKDVRILTVTCAPTGTAETLEHVASLRPDAIILRSYGIGNMPTTERLRSAVHEAIRGGILVVNTTQCFNGTVDMQYYDTGRMYAELGVVGCGDMTFEASFGKLFYLFHALDDVDAVKAAFLQNIAGERTPESARYNALVRKLFRRYQE